MYDKARYKRFLLLEFGALAVLIGSLFWLGQIMQGGNSLGLFHRLVPAVSSGLVLTGFLGCMHVRWFSVAASEQQPRRALVYIFWFLVFALFTIWLLAAAQWVMSDLSLPAES